MSMSVASGFDGILVKHFARGLVDRIVLTRFGSVLYYSVKCIIYIRYTLWFIILLLLLLLLLTSRLLSIIDTTEDINSYIENLLNH